MTFEQAQNPNDGTWYYADRYGGRWRLVFANSCVGGVLVSSSLCRGCLHVWRLGRCLVDHQSSRMLAPGIAVLLGCLVWVCGGARLWLCVRVFFILPRSVSGAMALVQPMAFIPLTFDWVRLKDPTSGRVYYSSECVNAERKLWQLRRSRTVLQIHRVFLLDETVRVWLATKGRRYHRVRVLRERGVRAPSARPIALRVL